MLADSIDVATCKLWSCDCCFSYRYRAPEVLLGNRHYTTSIDICESEDCSQCSTVPLVVNLVAHEDALVAAFHVETAWPLTSRMSVSSRSDVCHVCVFRVCWMHSSRNVREDSAVSRSRFPPHSSQLVLIGQRMVFVAGDSLND